ncbi:MAG: hypothetical protein AAFY22_13280, partial [Pseudomonadota bacterium]
MSLTYGVAALGRPTFDVPFAEEKLKAAFAALRSADITVVGPEKLLYDAQAAEEALAEISAHGAIDALLILQITFTDATMTVELAKRATAPVAIWAVPEPRLGGRLRLNAFCGLNLASHALGKAGIAHGWLYADPDAGEITKDLRALSRPVSLTPTAARTLHDGAQSDDGPADDIAAAALARLSGAAISVVGDHPAGFDTCSYDAGDLANLADITVKTVGLEALFDRARKTDADRVAAVRRSVDLAGLDAVNQEELDRSLRVFCALDDIRAETGASGLAVRCWPETFTEYGCAACGPMAMMNERKTPSACEADVYGSFSAMMLQELAGEPVWMADLVDLDFNDDTGVFWHCGLAPLSMCDPEATPEATIHTNRKMPLLHQFPLKPGDFTIARLSQARGQTKLVIGAATFLRAPMAFTGTSGVFKFNGGEKGAARAVCDAIIDEGLEHHYAIAYGDHRAALKAIAAR